MSDRVRFVVAAAVLAALALAACGRHDAAVSIVAVKSLRCESRVDPAGIDARRPRLSWILEAPAGVRNRGLRQTAYRVLVASSLESLGKNEGDLWDSGRVASDRSIQVEYAGRPLASRQVCHWKVRVWDGDGRASSWSGPASWSMGLLEPSDWEGGQWIGLADPAAERSTDESRRLAARYLRREFALGKPVARAVVSMSGLGVSELYVNGSKSGAEVLSPGLTDYDKRVFYVTCDVTRLLATGRNALGVILGNGRFHAPRTKVPAPTRTYGVPRLLLRLDVRFVDGSTMSVASDAAWRATDRGPVVANNEYDGEEYDARLEADGWDRPGFDDRAWKTADVLEAPRGVLAAEPIEPIRVTQTLRPVAVTSPRPGAFIFDMGQNIVGWCRMRVRGPAGTAVTLRHAETLRPDGNLYLDNLRSARVTDVYTLRGGGGEVYEPRFAFHGFRYVEVTGYPGTPTLDAIDGRVVHDDLRPAGTFACSNDLLNRIRRNIEWGARGNYRSIPTDCPQRDERQGWLGDRSAESRGEAGMFDVGGFYDKWAADMADAQRADGAIPDVAPPYWAFYNDGIVWPSSFVIVPAMLYDLYGDERAVVSRYAALRRWTDHMAGFLQDGLMPRNTYGDWCVPPESPKLIHSQDPDRQTSGVLISTAYFHHDLKLMARAAALAGEAADAERYRGLSETVRAAFHRKFFRAEDGFYDNGTATSCVLPLAFDMVPAEEKGRVFARLVRVIEVERGGHIATGLVGGQWLMRVLSDNGRADLAYAIATKTDYPSWGYMLAKGATTIWELWNGDTADPAMNSGNHVMLVGDLAIWMQEYLAGIRPDPAAPAFKAVVIKPTPVGDLTEARGTRESPYGTIRSEWSRQGDRFRLAVAIPVNATATVFVPAAAGSAVTESGKPLDRAPGVKFLRSEGGYAVLAVGSGAYEFVSGPNAGRN